MSPLPAEHRGLHRDQRHQAVSGEVRGGRRQGIQRWLSAALGARSATTGPTS